MSKGKPQVQYGLWPSALSAKDLAETLKLSEVEWDNDGTLVWLEGRSDGQSTAMPIDCVLRVLTGIGLRPLPILRSCPS